MNAREKHRKKCKQRTITFFIKDQAIYDYSKLINFTEFVKEQLRKELEKHGSKHL